MPLTPTPRQVVIASIVFVVVSVPGIPGVGFETRGAGAPSWVAVGYPVFGGILPLVAIALAWKWPKASGWCAIVAGIVVIAMNAADLARLREAPPPTVVAIDEVVVALVGAWLAWAGWRAARATP